MSFTGSYTSRQQPAPQYGQQASFTNNASFNNAQMQPSYQAPINTMSIPQQQHQTMPQMQQQQSFGTMNSQTNSFGTLEAPPPAYSQPVHQQTSLTLPPPNTYAPDKQISTMLMADQQATAAAQSQAGGMAMAGKTKEDRMYDATVKELAKIIDTKYRSQLVHKRGSAENVAYLIHRHCEALRMLGHVADEIIQHTNLMLQDARLDLDTIYSKTGGDYWCLKEAADFVRSLVAVFQKEAVTLHFPHYLQQQAYLAQMQSEQENLSQQQQTYAQQQQQQQMQQQQMQIQQANYEQRRRRPKDDNGDCVIM